LAKLGNGGVFANDAAIASKRQELCGFGRGIAKSVLLMLENPKAALKMWWIVSASARRGATEDEAIKNGLAELLPINKTYDIGFLRKQNTARSIAPSSRAIWSS
jgi:hypothetical protein